MSFKAKFQQYTIRNVPRLVDKALRQKAHQQKKSLNSFLLELVVKEVGDSEPALHTDLDHLIGSWVSDPQMEQSLVEQRIVDPKDWA